MCRPSNGSDPRQADMYTPRHGTAQVAPGIRLHYVEAGDADRVALLIHGFPETCREWSKVAPRLVEGGFRVVAPDYRGAGWSSKPAGGYDKQTMAGDLHVLLHDHCGDPPRVVVVGHDIGAMVAIAYALRYGDTVSHLVVIDAPIPGTAAFDRMRGDPRGWHAAFHGARDVAEMLVAGRERAYLRHMIEVRTFDPSGISAEDFESYVQAYEAPGAMRAAFELYRTFDADAVALRDALAGGIKLRIPTLAVVGELSGMGAVVTSMMREVAERVEEVVVPRSAHWVPEENPTALADALLTFCARA